MRRIVRLTERDLTRIVKRVINEQQLEKSVDQFGTPLLNYPRGTHGNYDINTNDGSTIISPVLELDVAPNGKGRKIDKLPFTATDGNGPVVEFDAVLRYRNAKVYPGGKDYYNYPKNKAFPIKAYYTCKTKLFLAKDPTKGANKGRLLNFESNNNIFTDDFTMGVIDSGLCPGNPEPGRKYL